MEDLPSKNFDRRPSGQDIDILIVHYTGMPSAEAALERLCDPASEVSAHYVIDENGNVYRLVAEHDRAWHAGVSSWAGASDINARSIGIELVNPGHEWGYRPFPAAQMAALVELAASILKRHPIPSHRVLGHSDVAPGRRQDPGELFAWSELAVAGIGMMPAVAHNPQTSSTLRRGDQGAEVRQLEVKLAAFGYGLTTTGIYDEATELVVCAFQRHFRPGRIDGVADRACQVALDDLLVQVKSIA